MISWLLVVCMGALVYTLLLRRLPIWEQRVLWAAYAAQVLASLAHVMITVVIYRGSGDMGSYLLRGREYAGALTRDPTLIPELFLALLQRSHNFPIPILLDGSSTGSMNALAGLLVFLLGDSMFQLSIGVAILSLFGQLAIYRVFRDFVSVAHRPRALLAAMFVPSVLFWSGGYMKESLGLAGLGFAVLALHWVIRGERRPASALLMVAGVMLIMFSKPYILLPLFVAGSFWWYVHRTRESQGLVLLLTQPFYAVLLVAGIVGALYVVGTILPRYSLESFADVAAKHQGYYASQTSGSSFAFGNPEERSLMGQLAFAPLALLTALFRPFLFEVRNLTMAMAALETSLVIGLTALMFVRSGFLRIYLFVLRNPLLTFCLVFTLMFAVAVGLTTANFGTLSRYRAPMMPFYAYLVLLLSARFGTRAGEGDEGEDGELAGELPQRPDGLRRGRGDVRRRLVRTRVRRGRALDA